MPIMRWAGSIRVRGLWGGAVKLRPPTLQTSAPLITLNADHLARWKDLIARWSPAQISEHLAWSVSESVYHNDLLPIPYTEEALDHICPRIDCIQETFDRPLLIENPSSYMAFKTWYDSTLHEMET